MGEGAETFVTVYIFCSKANLGDGSMQNIDNGTKVKWEVDFSEIDPQDLQNMEEKEVNIFL
jgi:hypothetical protein